MLKIIKKVLSILLLAVVFVSNAGGLVKAAYDLTDAYIVKIGNAPYHLKYYNSSKGMYTYSICSIVGHYEDGVFYPAYCLNRDLNGVGEISSYTVDVDETISDNKVWRAVKNGYPYKSAGEMGLESDFDAFAVTKFAVYCLTGQSDLDLFTADESDSEGQAMLRALHNLVDIGLNGGDIFSDELRVNKIGDFTEDGDYYSLTYKVSAGSTVSSYIIKEVTGIQDGDLVTDVNGNIKTAFSSGENFKIKILKSHLDSNKDINIKLEAKLKNYPMFYGKTRISGSQNYLLTANSYQNVNTSINTNLKLNTAKIKINKVDNETRAPIQDTVFELYNSKNELIDTKTSDSNGVIEFLNLYQGEYVLKEKEANEKYELANYEEKISVKYNKTVERTIENKPKKGNLIINKVDKDNPNITLGNIEFELYDENGKKVGTYNTDNNGKIEINNIRIGKYLLKETNTNKWYNLAEDTLLEVKWNETQEETIENELKKSQIKIIKVDKDDNKIKIPNVVFEVQDINGNVLETITTDEEGVAITKKYPTRDFKKLKLCEVSTDEMYVLDEEIKEIELEENKITDITFENEKIKGEIQIIKKTAEESKVTGIKKGAPLDGVVFEVYDKSGKVVDTVTTNEEGIARTKKLEKGTYKVKEKATNEWYFLDENYYTINIENNNEIYYLNIENTPKIPEEEIVKTGPEFAKVDEVIEYKINVKNTGNVPLNNFIWEDEIPTDYIRLTKINLGTYNQQNTYNLYYKTNLSDEYILFMEGISTSQNEQIDFTKELKENEYITNLKLDFGTVEVGFESETETSIFTKVDSNLKRDDVFKNRVTLTSNYNGQYLVKDSTWETKIYKILPVTGM